MTAYALEFESIGKRLCQERLVSANFGNMSVRRDEGFLITRTGSFLDNPGEPVFVPLEGDVPREASSEFRLHREVYRRTGHDAVVHAHPVHAVALSLGRDHVITLDSEGQMFAPKIPVVGGAPGSMEMADNVAGALAGGNLVIVRGHGTFAAGKSLEEAYILTSLAEHSCRVIILSERAG
ncbi:MAG: aldolase [Methanolinea sp.]|jgi:L-fuculose-phosphate aldolase|nr:aldolase [Methanolinea sp.]